MSDPVTSPDSTLGRFTVTVRREHVTVSGNEVVFAGLTRPQLFLLACAPLFVWHVVRQARRGTYRLRVKSVTA